MKEKQRVLRRITSLVLTVCMVLTLLPSMPLTVYAASAVEYIDLTWNEEKKALDSKIETATGCTEVDNTTTIWSEGWYVVNSNVTINERVTVSGAVNLILCDGATLNAAAGIEVNDGNSLIIYAQSDGWEMGALTATGDTYVAGIGSDQDSDAGEIIIKGGRIEAYGYASEGYVSLGAGIGGGWEGSGGTITINGGTIIACSSFCQAGYGAGIGGGKQGSGGTITINGGTVTAYSTRGDNTQAGYGAGIGGGQQGSGGTITINGGTVTAYSAYENIGYGAGIGGGKQGSGGTIAINGGSVTAYCTLGDRIYGDGIGNGEEGSGANISIQNAIVTAKGAKAFSSKTTISGYYGYKTSKDAATLTLMAANTDYSTAPYMYIAPGYMVEFKANASDACNTMESQFIATDTRTALLENTFARTGYSFSGWADLENDSVKYKDKAYVENLTDTNKSITLYAVWTLAEPDVTVELSPSDGVAYEKDVTLTANIGNKSENLTYTYAWYKDDETAPVGSEESLTLNEVSESGEYRVEVTVTDNSTQKSKKSSPVTVTINPETLNIGEVSAETVENTLDASAVKLNRTNEIIAGELTLTDTVLQWGEHEYGWEFIPDSKYNGHYDNDTATGTVKITVTDSIAPAAKYQLGTDADEREFTTETDFSIFCKGSETVTLTYSDEVSGVKSVQYYIANEAIADTEAITEWTVYNAEQKISLEESGKYFIYVRLEDNAGNTAIYHTEGIVIYEESVIKSETVEYTYKENEDLTVSIDLKGNSIKEITDQDDNTLDSSAYTITEDGIVLSAPYLDSLNVGDYTYTLTQYPQGIQKNEITSDFKLNVKKAELTVDNPDKSYLYLRENADTIDLASMLPADCGMVTYGTPSVSGNVTYSVAPVISEGELSYTVGKGNVGDTGTITIDVETQNYEDITIEVKVQLIDQISVSLKEGSDVTLENDTLIYGEALSNLVFNSAVFVGADGKEVTGTLAWKDKTATPDAGTTSAAWVFTPENIEYASLEGTVGITVNKATPVISAVPTVSDIVYNPNVPLSDEDLKGGTVSANGNTVSGTWSWQTANVVPTVNNDGYVAVFTPDSTNYNQVTTTITVTVTKATPHIETAPSAAAITYGEELSASVLSGSAQYSSTDSTAVAGSFTWKDSTVKPAVADSNSTAYTVIFTPADKENYNAVETTTTVVVNKATPVISAVPTVGDIEYNPNVPLSDEALKGGAVSANGNTVSGTWSWKTANVVPTVNNDGYVAVFTPNSTNYNQVTTTITVTVTKATPHIETAPSAAAITYGEELSASVLSGTAQHSSTDPTTVAGSFAWKDSTVKPAVADSNSTAYTVVFTPADEANYNAVETTTTLIVNKAENAPNMPDSTMNVPNNNKKISDVALPDGWEWQDTDRAVELKVETPVQATAVYIGADKGNYEKETVLITVTRANCDHTPGDILYTGVGESEPTCENTGLGHKECTKCEETVESGIVVDALGHTGGTASCSEKAVCTRCQHEYGELDAKNHGETEVRNVKTATCKEEGYTGDTYCKDCKEKVSAGQAIDKLTTHTWNDGEVTKEATCTEAGEKTYICTVCEVTRTEAISAAGHQLSKVEKVEATCTTDGSQEYWNCTECGKKFSNEQGSSEITDETTLVIPAAGHTGGTATCTKKAVCTTCQKEYGELDANTHGETEVKDAKAATCKEEGYTGDTYCKECGVKVSAGQAIAKLTAHTWNEGVVTTEPTATEKGTKTYTCTVCGATQTEEIPALGGSTDDNSGNSTGNDNTESNTVNGYTTLASAEKTLLTTNTDKGDAKDSAFAKLQLKATGKKKSVKLTWKKVKGADGYIVYGGRCGSSMKKLKTIKGSSKVTYTHTKLKAGKYYKYMVVAYKVVDGKKCIITTSKSAHAVTTSSKYANPTKVSVKSTKMTIKKGKKATIKASYTLLKGKKSQTHIAKFRYESSNTKVATVSKKGVVKAKKKGTAYIYVYAQNGIYKKVKITVK